MVKARRSAIGAIMSRNASHNVGSHVTPRTSIKKIKERLSKEDIPYSEVVIELLKDRLDKYIQEKSDFLAEITTEPLASTKPAFFYKQVILPFVENTLLMDNIAANEGVNYKPGLTENRLKIQVLRNGKKLKASFHSPNRTNNQKYVYPEKLPYSLWNPDDNSQDGSLQLDRVENANLDVEIELPGPLGEMAFYGFLENYIRNVAKHNKKKLDKNPSTDLKIRIEIDEPTDNAEKAEFYLVKISDNFTDPKEAQNKEVDGKKCETLEKLLQTYIESDIIDSTGGLQRRAWGIAEMKVCATLLSGSTDFGNMNKNLTVLAKNGKLVYELKLMKSRQVCAIINQKVNNTRKIELQQKGIWIFGSVPEFLENSTTRTKASFRFAVLNAKCVGEYQGNFEDLMPRFPFRVLLTGAKNNNISEQVKALIDCKRILT